MRYSIQILLLTALDTSANTRSDILHDLKLISAHFKTCRLFLVGFINQEAYDPIYSGIFVLLSVCKFTHEDTNGTLRPFTFTRTINCVLI